MENKILVTQSSMPEFDEYMNEISSMWDSHWLTNMGPKHMELQENLCDYLDVENIDLLTNGHMALELTLQAMNLQGEVITTPFTFASTTHAIVRNGLIPVFCDIDPETYCMDTAKIERLITDRTCAIMPVHVYGNVCNIEEIERIAHKYELKVIYDAAHTFGETYKGKGIGSYGDVSCFSFHATKVFNSIEGGAVCFGNELKNFGLDLYRLKNLDGVAGIQLSPIQKDVKPNYAYFPVVFDDKVFGATRNEVFDKLAENEIGARKYFYPLTNSFDCFHGKYDLDQTPVARYISNRVLTLPLYADLALEDVDRICEIVLKCRG